MISFCTGRLIKDPEEYTTKSGNNMAAFAVIHTRDRKDIKTGTYPDDIFNFAAFGKTAEYIMKYVKKGYMVQVTSRVETKRYEYEGVKNVPGFNFTVLTFKRLDTGGKKSVSDSDSDLDRIDQSDNDQIQSDSVPF